MTLKEKINRFAYNSAYDACYKQVRDSACSVTRPYVWNIIIVSISKNPVGNIVRNSIEQKLNSYNLKKFH